MTKRDFFRVLIKIFGLYSGFITVFSIIPAFTSNLSAKFEPLLWLLILGIVFLALLLVYFLIYKTDFIIDKLKLDKGFDEERIYFENFNNENIFKLAIILIGGFLIVDYLPSFLNHTFQAFKSKLNNSDMINYPLNYFNWISSGLNIILGYLLLTNYKKTAIYLNKI